MEPQSLDEACTNESLAAASDVAVGGSVGGRHNNSPGTPPAVAAAPALEASNPNPEASNIIAVQPRKHTHFRKRAWSTATSATMESNTLLNQAELANLPSSGISLMNNSLNPNNMNESGMGSGGEHSIVSFGLNFNFDSTSSPSNSDSGEANEKGDGKGEGSEEENKAVGSEGKKKGGEANGAKVAKKAFNGSGSGGERGGSNNKTKKAKPQQQQTAANNNNNTEENSAESASDSGQDQYYNSGGSSASGSGNDGSSGGKSTVSSLTTSSNQEWMATSESKAVKGGEGEDVNAAGNKKGGEGAGEDDPKATKKDGAAQSGKKRKKASKTSQGEAEGNVNDEDSTGGYNTDEEQWGVKINNKGTGGVGNSIVHKQHHVVTTNAGNSDPSSLTESNSANSGKGEGPPVKQARFSIDQHPHPRAIPSAETSAQMGLSSLSSNTPIPAVTSTSGRTPMPSSTTAALTSSSNNPSTLTAPISSGTQPVRAKRGSSGKHHSATLDPRKREERNAREKERSCRIAKQIDDLRSLLSRGGVIVAKGTKSSVLAEAANYINMLQQQQVQWEMDRQSLLQQMQEVGVNPSAGPSQAQTPHNGMPPMNPNNNMTGQQLQSVATAPINPLAQGMTAFNSIEPNDYKFIFNNSSVGMAIASMGGAFVDCNENFCKLSEFSKEEVCSMTIFNMTSQNDLQHAFDLISQMITPTLEGPQDKSKTVILRGAMKNRNDLGLSISLIKGDHGIGKCFCVTLVRILSMDESRPDVVSVEMELPVIPTKNNVNEVGFGTSPAYTSG